IRVEPKTSEDTATGLVLSAILNQIDCVGSLGEFVSVADVPLDRFHNHPWGIGGGGAAELRTEIESRAKSLLGRHLAASGFVVITGQDDCLMSTERSARRRGWKNFRPIGSGEQ